MALGWTRRGGLVCATAATLLLAPLAEAALADGSLVVTPESAQARPDTVTVSGTCPPLPEKPPDEGLVIEAPPGGFVEGPGVVEEPAEPTYPAKVTVSIVDFEVPQSFDVNGDGTFGGSFPLPDPLPPATYTFQASLPDLGVEAAGLDPVTCDGTDTLVVNPFLDLSKDEVVAGNALTASGTCPVAENPVELRLGEELVGSGAVDGSTGRFSGLELRIPADSARGATEIVSSCGTAAPLTIQGLPASPGSDPASDPPSDPPASDPPASDPPADQLVEVPNLVGLSQAEARTKVGKSLLLDVSGAGEEIESQDPKAGAQVTAGSTVAVTLGAGPLIPKSVTAVVPAWSLVVAVVLLVAAVARPFVARAARSGRERRWARRAVFRARLGGWSAQDAPVEPVPGLSLTFATELGPDPLQFEEVGGVRT